MNKGNFLIAAAVAGFLYLGGYILLSKVILGIAALTGLASLTRSLTSKKKEKSKPKNPNLMDPIEIETTRKPDYKIPSDITMKVSPDKSPSKTKYQKGIEGTFGSMAKLIGKKLKK